jgi:DNA helicase-2/ATP-dependent DNA helicase PcrA
MKYYDDNSLHRTIHKAKGDEFDNVFVILPDKADWVSNEEELLSFLLNPDLNKEEHRVYYVALSRARKRLFINIPKLSTTNQEKLKEIGFNIEKY